MYIIISSILLLQSLPKKCIKDLSGSPSLGSMQTNSSRQPSPYHPPSLSAATRTSQPHTAVVESVVRRPPSSYRHLPSYYNNDNNNDNDKNIILPNHINISFLSIIAVGHVSLPYSLPSTSSSLIYYLMVDILPYTTIHLSFFLCSSPSGSTSNLFCISRILF